VKYTSDYEAPAAAVPSADGEAAVRDAVNRFTRAAKRKDRVEMERLLRADFCSRRLPIRHAQGKDELGRAEVVALWADPDRTYAWFSYGGVDGKDAVIRLHGTTAVETGLLSVDVWTQDIKTGGVYRNVRYVRVWMKDAGGWRVAHESF
jgi:hypothetical protein